MFFPWKSSAASSQFTQISGNFPSPLDGYEGRMFRCQIRLLEGSTFFLFVLLWWPTGSDMSAFLAGYWRISRWNIVAWNLISGATFLDVNHGRKKQLFFVGLRFDIKCLAPFMFICSLVLFCVGRCSETAALGGANMIWAQWNSMKAFMPTGKSLVEIALVLSFQDPISGRLFFFKEKDKSHRFGLHDFWKVFLRISEGSDEALGIFSTEKPESPEPRHVEPSCKCSWWGTVEPGILFKDNQLGLSFPWPSAPWGHARFFTSSWVLAGLGMTGWVWICRAIGDAQCAAGTSGEEKNPTFPPLVDQ